jgi:hypothetical protein
MAANATLTPENLLGAPMRGLRGVVFKRFKRLENDRYSWRAQWIELSDYLQPRRGRFLTEDSQVNKGRKRFNKIVDNTGGIALRTMAQGMQSGVTNPARPWFRLDTLDPERMEVAGARDWLGTVERAMRRMLSTTNFYNNTTSYYTELGMYGTASMIPKRHPDRVMNFRPYTAGEYVIAENHFNEVDTLGREFTMTVSQIVEEFIWDPVTEKFDWEKGSKTLKNLWDNSNYDELIRIIHMIYPRRAADVDDNLPAQDRKRLPWADVYIELSSEKDNIVLAENGWEKFPAYVTRWDLTHGDVWGISPGMETLGDVKQLQQQQRRKAQAIDKMVNPPLTAHTALKGKPATALPGGITYVDPVQGSQGLQPLYQVQPRLAEMTQDIREVQQRISRGFYADLFAMMIESDRRQITATEVAVRQEEKLSLLGPALQRINTEFLDPLVDDAFAAVVREELVPPPPPDLEGQELEVKYISLLHQAQEAVNASAIERVFSFAGNLAPAFPNLLDNLDEDEALQEYADILGVPPKVVRDREAVDGRRQARAQERQAQEQQAAAMQGAEAAKLLSETDTQSPNALTELLSQGGAGPSSSVP